MKAAFPFSQVVIVMAVVVSPVLEAALSSGVLQRATITAPGAATCTTTMAVCTGTSEPTTSIIGRPEPPFVASGIDYLWARLAVERR